LTGTGWTGADGVTPRRTDWGLIPPGLDSMREQIGGDITGKQGTGAGAGKRARAVGNGIDRDAARAQAAVDWLEARAERAELDAAGSGAAEEITAEIMSRRASIAASVAAKVEIPARILALCGGPGWGVDSRIVVRLGGGGMAARAARYVVSGNGRGGRHFTGRGRAPSQTSLQDAAAAAAAACWFEWQCYSALCGDDWTPGAVRYLAGAAWRAAFRSLTQDASEGRTGRKAGCSTATGADSVSLADASLAVERASLQAWADDRQGRIFNPGESEEARTARARRDVIEWITGVLDVRAKGRTGAAERARASVLIRVIHGRDFATAARCAGFATGRAAVESFRSGKVWARLRAAVTRRVTERERALHAMRARAAGRAAVAIRMQRAASPGAGRADVQPATARTIIRRRFAGVRLDHSGAVSTLTAARLGTVTVRSTVLPEIVTVPGKAGRGAVHPMAGPWADCVAVRAEAVSMAHNARGMLIAARADRAAQFDHASAGWRRGWLR
jgi:hypothetical protein